MDPIVIVGGGIIGTSIAYHLRDADRPVRLLERDMLGAGATAESAAMLTEHHHKDPEEWDVSLRQHAREEYEKLIADGTIDFDTIGTLDLATSEARMAEIEETAEQLAALGVDVSVLEPAELSQYGIVSDALHGAFHLPDDGVLDPGEIVQYFAEEARQGGVEIETDVTVTDITVTDGSVQRIETDTGTLEPETVINATGPWANQLNAMVGVSVPMRHTLGPIVVLQPGRPVSLPFVFFEEGVYLRQEGRDQLLAGNHARSYEEAEVRDPAHAREVDESMYLEIADVADAYLEDDAALDVANEWVGLRTIMPDSRPAVGETTVDGYYLAVGMGGYGVTLAPAIGDLVARDLQTDSTPALLDGLSPTRFFGD